MDMLAPIQTVSLAMSQWLEEDQRELVMGKTPLECVDLPVPAYGHVILLNGILPSHVMETAVGACLLEAMELLRIPVTFDPAALQRLSQQYQLLKLDRECCACQALWLHLVEGQTVLPMYTILVACPIAVDYRNCFRRAIQKEIDNHV